MAYTAIFQDSALSNLSDGLAEDYLRKETSDYDDFQNKEYVKILRGDVIENDSLKSFQGKDLAQAHFYAGIRFSILGQNKIALSHFKRAEDIGWQYHIESGSYFPEMIMARGEIRRLSGDSWLLRYVDTKISERSSDEELLMEQIQKEDSLTARALLAHVGRERGDDGAGAEQRVQGGGDRADGGGLGARSTTAVGGRRLRRSVRASRRGAGLLGRPGTAERIDGFVPLSLRLCGGAYECVRVGSRVWGGKRLTPTLDGKLRMSDSSPL